MNDIQIPFQDDPVLELVLSFVDDLKPYGVVLNGDITDCYAISSHRTDARELTKSHLQREIDGAGELMNRLKRVKEKWWLEGNHEERFSRNIKDRAPQLGLIDELDYPHIFKLEKYGFRWKEYGDYVMLGKLMVTHGEIVRKHSAYTAKAHFDKYGTSVLHGHTHRIGAYYHTNIAGPHVSWENGCLCRLDGLGYTKHPDWQQGFSVIHVDDNGFFNVQQIPILRRKLFYYGKDKWSR